MHGIKIDKGVILIKDIDLTDKQMELLADIHTLGREMEAIKNDGKVHAVIALIEELSAGTIAWSYLKEKIQILLSE